MTDLVRRHSAALALRASNVRHQLGRSGLTAHSFRLARRPISSSRTIIRTAPHFLVRWVTLALPGEAHRGAV